MPKECDILIQNGTLVTLDSQASVIRDGSIAVDQGRMIDIGPSGRLSRRYRGSEAIDARGTLVMPGLVNSHTHAAMTLFRGYADDLHLKEWLEGHMWPLEKRFINPASVRTGTRLALCEMMRSGTTAFNDMYMFEDVVAKASSEAGMRVVAGELLLDFPTAASKSPGHGMRLTERQMRRWHGHPLVTMATAPHSPYACSGELLQGCRDLADRNGSQVHIHLSETEGEVGDMRKREGVSPVRYLERLGVLSGRVLAAHCVHVDREDIQALARNGAGIAHNPESNMKLASGVAPVPEMVSAGARVGLATDSAASNNDLDMLGEMSTAARLHKAFSRDPTAIDAETVVRMATLGSARALGLDREIGSLERGKRADIILLDLRRPHLTPLYNAYSHIVYSASGHDVRDVVIEGRAVMRDRELLTLDEEAIMREAHELGERIGAG